MSGRIPMINLEIHDNAFNDTAANLTLNTTLEQLKKIILNY